MAENIDTDVNAVSTFIGKMITAIASYRKDTENIATAADKQLSMAGEFK